MQGSLHIQREIQAGVCVITTRGELDMSSAPQFSEALGEVIRDGGSDMVVDLTGVSFVDSTGLAVLLNTLRRLTRARRRMAVVTGSGAVGRAFEVTRLHWTFDVFDDVETAVARSGATSEGEAAAAG